MEIIINKELFQWEKNRYVYINLEEGEDLPSYLQFYNKKSKKALQRNISEGKALIPNQLLKQNLPIMVLACLANDNETLVLTRKEFKVLSCPKPENYIDDETGIEIIYDGGMEV